MFYVTVRGLVLRIWPLFVSFLSFSCPIPPTPFEEPRRVVEAWVFVLSLLLYEFKSHEELKLE